MMAKAFDKRFDRGDNVTKHLRLSAAKRRGQAQKRVNIDFPVWMIQSLDKAAHRLGVPRQSVIKLWGGGASGKSQIADAVFRTRLPGILSSPKTTPPPTQARTHRSQARPRGRRPPALRLARAGDRQPPRRAPEAAGLRELQRGVAGEGFAVADDGVSALLPAPGGGV